MIYENYKDLLLKESSFLKEAFDIQEKIREAVMNRDWEGFEDYFTSLNEIGKKLSNLEAERELLFSAYEAKKEGEKSSFYEIVSTLPDEQRKDLLGIYNNLKMEALRFRMSNNAFMSYLTGIRSTLNEFFELAFPERSAKMYTVRGTHHSNDMQSMVLNRSF